MFGLRPENDRNSVRSLQPTENSRNSKFVERLYGRFNVSGISGSFQKHNKEKSVSKTKKRIVDYQQLYHRHQEDIERDAKQLQELQFKLIEVSTQSSVTFTADSYSVYLD
jgi:N-acetyl-gamma-glutamylphosphate reductase